MEIKFMVSELEFYPISKDGKLFVRLFRFNNRSEFIDAKNEFGKLGLRLASGNEMKKLYFYHPNLLNDKNKEILGLDNCRYLSPNVSKSKKLRFATVPL